MSPVMPSIPPAIPPTQLGFSRHQQDGFRSMTNNRQMSNNMDMMSGRQMSNNMDMMSGRQMSGRRMRHRTWASPRNGGKTQCEERAPC